MSNFQEVNFSPYELCILHDKAFFEAKQAIINKWDIFLSNLAEHIKSWISEKHEHTLPEEVKNTTPKISRGENYQGMPYMVLDYPRFFGKKDTFAFRNILLWNRGLYSTLLFEGKYMDYAIQEYNQRGSTPMYLHQNTDKWVHELTEQDIYIENPDSDECKALLQSTQNKLKYLKFTNFLSFQDWSKSEKNGMTYPLYNSFRALINFVTY